MGTLEERYRDDPDMLAFLKKRLPIRGWAGKLDDCEREYLLRTACPWYVSAVEKGQRLAAKHPIEKSFPVTQTASAGERG